MASFQQLVDTTSKFNTSSDDWQTVSATLVPLAALALHAADRIEGLPELLASHSWSGDGFATPPDLRCLQQDLWMLFSAHKASALVEGLTRVTEISGGPADASKHAADASKYAADVSNHAADATKYAADATKHAADATKHAADVSSYAGLASKHADRKRAWVSRRPFDSFREVVQSLQGSVSEGQLLNELTHFAQLSIIEAGKAGMDAEGFKRILRTSGWNQDHYAFLSRPDGVALIARLDGLIR